ncbi:MAG: aspartate 1-decarboxylase [Acidobacteria bacterium]|nr:aspartate 1-decarboxylase [Acidobacteriota bacterium]
MRRDLLRAKIHRATVTDTNVEYEGSLTLDTRLMAAAGLVPFERIDVYNVNNGARFSTYVIEGEPAGGTVCVNGAAARLATAGDKVIIAAYASFEESEIASHEPRVVLVDAQNRITATPAAGAEHAAAASRAPRK